MLKYFKRIGIRVSGSQCIFKYMSKSIAMDANRSNGCKQSKGWINGFELSDAKEKQLYILGVKDEGV